MNIFILSDNRFPATHYAENARYHIDKHVVKMILESTQMLCTALSYAPYANLMSSNLCASAPCKPLAPGMRKHPCTMWTMFSPTYFNYLTRLAIALCNEHQYRYPLSAEHEYTDWLNYLGQDLDELGLTIATPLPEMFATAVKDPALRSAARPWREAVNIYRNYYYQDKLSFATWKDRPIPYWFGALQPETPA